ncbi:MAG TPA: MarC family protein [Chloroflexota bacterium]
MSDDLLRGFGMTTFLSVLPILNPFGAMPVFAALTMSQPLDYQRRMAWRTALNVFVIMVVALLAGRAVLAFFGVSVGHLQVAGGLIVARTAWHMSAGGAYQAPAAGAVATEQDISFSPLALPLLSGPGVIGLLIATASHSDRLSDYLTAIMALALLGLITYVCLRLSTRVSKRLGAGGIDAMSRIMGFIVLAIAVNLIAEGAAVLMRELHI